MGRIRSLVEPQLGAAHDGKLTQAQYNELATRIGAEVGGIVANCKLEPKADANMLANLSMAAMLYAWRQGDANMRSV